MKIIEDRNYILKMQKFYSWNVTRETCVSANFISAPLDDVHNDIEVY